MKRVQENELERVASKSLVNCHTVGVDSIVFDDTPGAVVRAFIANENHTLYLNSPYSSGPLSVALHAHHCEVTLKPIFGEIRMMT